MFQFHPDDVASNLIVSNGMIMWWNRELFSAKPSDSMILIRCDANRLFVLKQPISFDQPVSARDVHIGNRLEKIIRPRPDQNTVRIILDIVITYLKIYPVLHCDPCLTVVVDLIVLQSAIA